MNLKCLTQIWGPKVFFFFAFSNIFIFYNLYVFIHVCPEGSPNCYRSVQARDIVNNKIRVPGPSFSLQSKALITNAYRNNNSVGRPERLANIPITVTSFFAGYVYVIKKYHAKTLQFRNRFNCSSILNGSKEEIMRINTYHRHHRPVNGYPTINPESTKSMFYDCAAFRKIRGYVMEAGSPEEESFPIAYVILAHLDFEHLERLLKALYRPQHVFCIHLDQKVTDNLKQAISGLASCFPNVILASSPQNVIYAHVSRLMADIGCMKDLLDPGMPWKYLINIAATSYPLRSNAETVQILKLLNGKNDIHEVFSRRAPERWKVEYVVKKGRIRGTNKTLESPPHNLTLVKGQAYNTYSREFIQWVFNDQRARDLLRWSHKTYSPDEHYWATLNNLYHNPALGTPGGFKGHPDRKGYITMAVSWVRNNANHICQGRNVHNICLLASGDLQYISQRNVLTANKFDLFYDPVAYSCMEEWLENKTTGIKSYPMFDITHYKRLYFIWFDPDKEAEKQRIKKQKTQTKLGKKQEKKK